MHLGHWVVLAAVIVLFGGCAAEKQFGPVSRIFLTDVDTNKQLSNMPFAHSWVWVDVDRDKYKAVYVRPVRTDTLSADAW